jgi:hypothetical protein
MCKLYTNLNLGACRDYARTVPVQMRQEDARQRTNRTKARRRGSLPIEPPDQNGGISLPMPSSGLSRGCLGSQSVVLARHWHLPTRIRRPSPSQPRPRRQLASRAARRHLPVGGPQNRRRLPAMGDASGLGLGRVLISALDSSSRARLAYIYMYMTGRDSQGRYSAAPAARVEKP